MLVPSPKPAKLLEKEVTGQIRDFLKVKGWRALRMNPTVVMQGRVLPGETGIPDYFFVKYIKPGISATLWVELKRPGGKLRPKQIEWIAKEQQRGATIWVVDSFTEFADAYSRSFSWLHDGRLPGQMEMFG
jgi:hypothetical protein